MSLLALSLSSFSLLVIQSTMGGMQSQVIKRSKSIEGSYQLLLKGSFRSNPSKLIEYLSFKNIRYLVEVKKELLLKKGQRIKPVIVHGVDRTPPFIKSQTDSFEILIPYTMSYALEIDQQDKLTIYSPYVLDSFFSDVPSRISLQSAQFFESNLPEIDSWHIWIKLSKLQNLLRSKQIDLINVYQRLSDEMINVLQLKFGNSIEIVRWEDTHETLTWALKLENFIMMFLFASMSLLVSLSIISGFLFFWEKIKFDLSYFWVVGVSRKLAFQTTLKFIINLNFVSIVIGLLFGTAFLMLFKKLAPNLMPDVFVDRSIPVIYKFKFYLISFLVPFIISCFFSMSLTYYFAKETDFFKFLKKGF